MNTELGLRRNGRADPLDMHIGLIGLARELEQAQQLVARLQLDVEDLGERAEQGEVVASYLFVVAVLLALLLVVLIVFAFHPMGLPR